MMPKTINVQLSSASINAAIAELESVKTWIKRKTEQLNERLKDLATSVAEQEFGAALYDGDNDVRLVAEATEDGWTITASGKAVLFIEYGAGVHYNTPDPYPEPRPADIAGIGEYGFGLGKQQSWGFYDGSGNLVITHGNPAAMPMYKARAEIYARLNAVAKEVFASD